MHLYQIVYSSNNCIRGSELEVEAEIASILSKSRANNQLAGITGALLFNGKGFAQVLEGPADVVEAAYERIQCDPRHSDVVLLSNGICSKKSFSDWSMAYADPSCFKNRAHEAINLDEICADPDSGGSRILEALQQLISCPG